MPVRTVAQILAEPGALDPPRAVLPRLGWGGRVTLLAGREKLGKSTLAAAGAVSSGKPFLGTATAAASVLWIGLEEHPADTARRFREFRADERRVFVLDTAAGPGDLRSAADGVKPAVIVLDSLAAYVAGRVSDASSSAAWTAALAPLVRLARDTGAALVLVHHARKSDGAYRDSSAIGASVDAILELRPGKEAAIREVTGVGRWRLSPFAVRLEGDAYELVSGELSAEDRVTLFVRANPGCSKRQLRDGVTGKASATDAAANELLESGTLEDRGDSTVSALFAKDRDAVRDAPENGSVSSESSTDTRRDAVAGHGEGGERVPIPNPRGEQRDTPPGEPLGVLRI